MRALAPMGDPVEGLFTIRPEGSNAIHVPWLITVRPRHDELLSSIRLSSRSFEPSDNAPAVLSFQAEVARLQDAFLHLTEEAIR